MAQSDEPVARGLPVTAESASVRGLGARTSGPHVFMFHRSYCAAVTPGPALTAVSPLRFISKQLCAGDMRTGGPRTREALFRCSEFLSLPVFAKSTFFMAIAFCGWKSWVRGPPARMSSCFTAATARQSRQAQL